MPSTQVESRWPHCLAMLLASTVFPAIWVGSLVTTYQAGMAVPDWPSTYGYNLFLYPWTTWVYGPWDLFIEHGHRLLTAFAGMITIALVAATWICRSRLTVKAAAVIGLVLILIQGAIGGARVLFDERQFALVHGCLGPAFFAYCAGMIVLTSRWWVFSDAAPGGQAVKRLSFLTVCLSYFQLILGANLRHLGPDSPFRALVIFHIVMAFVLLAHVFALTITACVWHADHPRLMWGAAILCGLITMQIVLGGGAFFVNYSLPALESTLPSAADFTIEAEGRLQTSIVTLHVATGSLILAWATVLALCFWRLFRNENVDAFAPGAAA